MKILLLALPPHYTTIYSNKLIRIINNKIKNTVNELKCRFYRVPASLEQNAAFDKLV